MQRLRDIPGWGQLILALGVLLASLAFTWGSFAGDLRVEATTREQVDIRIERSVEEIKQLLKQEIDRHHPRE